MNIPASEIIKFLDKNIIEIQGDTRLIFVKYLKNVQEVDQYTLDWVGPKNQNKQEYVENSKAPVIICDTNIVYNESLARRNKILIKVTNPKLCISLVANHFMKSKIVPKICESSYIDSFAIIKKDVFIGNNCSIGKCEIGEGSIIQSNVVIYDQVKINKNVIIQSGSVIGVDGLGCERMIDGSLVKFPHFGGVEIHNNVEIGANCIIARGALSNTIIGEGCKINGHTTIAHNCYLGKNVWISFNSTIAGSTVVSDNVTIFSNVVIREHLKIGKDSIIGMGAVLTKNVPAGEVWYGNPARKYAK